MVTYSGGSITYTYYILHVSIVIISWLYFIIKITNYLHPIRSPASLRTNIFQQFYKLVQANLYINQFFPSRSTSLCSNFAALFSAHPFIGIFFILGQFYILGLFVGSVESSPPLYCSTWHGCLTQAGPSFVLLPAFYLRSHTCSLLYGAGPAF
jgi:hypothetical protein